MEKSQSLLLDHQLCFALYACSREVTRMYRPLLDRLGLTYPQYLVLLVLWEEGEITVKGLGERLYLDSGTLTPMLKRMESAGWIRRRRSGKDERQVVIALTAKGEALKEEARCIPETLMVQSSVSGEEYRSLLRQLKELLQRVHRHNEGQEAESKNSV